MKSGLKFTGERMIPEHNKHMDIYYDHYARYLFAASIVKNKSVLDAGCGSGYGSFLLKHIGLAKSVIGVDASKESIKYAKQKYNLPAVQYNVDDVMLLKSISSNTVDVAVSFEVIEHLADQQKYMEQIKRVLKPDSLFIVSTPNTDVFPGNPYHTREFTVDQFRNFLHPFFKHINLYSQSFLFANKIQKVADRGRKVEGEFLPYKRTVYEQAEKNAPIQYQIAICSNRKIKHVDEIMLISKKIDEFDMTNGFFSLKNQLETYRQQQNNIISELTNQNQELVEVINSVRSARFFKLWQLLNRVKKFIRI